jgi:peptidyl-tRNA hydrolase, PTH1 family
MKLVVGLGNPGEKYKNTRHNIGFEVLDELSKRTAGSKMAKFEGQLMQTTLGSEAALLLWPLTMMNLSGRSVGAVSKFYKIEPSDILVVCDDLALPLGKLRFRGKGSAGGQKGLADILRILGSEELARLRIGIDATPEGWDTADYVLSRFKKDEALIVDNAVKRAADGVIDWAASGVEYCMNRYNSSQGN